METATVECKNQPNAAVLSRLRRLLDARFPQQPYSYRLCMASSKGDNYIGVIYRVSVTIAGDDNNDDVEADGDANSAEQPFSLILKVPPENAARRNQFFARPCFLREALAYDQFLPLIAEFQRSAGLVHDGFREYPMCYDTMTDELNEAIFLQDLCADDQFRLFSRFEHLTRDHVALVMRIYAKLHAVSLAIKHTQPAMLQPFQQIVDIFEERKDDVQLGAYFEELKRSTLATMAYGDERYSQTLSAYFARDTFFQLLLPLIGATDCEPYAVVCHGDCWVNNILFKYEQGRVVDARIIDWQLMRYASPVTDLLYFLFTCTTREFRLEHFEAMLDVYYSELSRHLSRLGDDANVLFPRSAFDAQLRCMGAAGLLMAMIVLPIITMRGEDVPSLDELSARIESGATTDPQDAGLLVASNANDYNRRMRDVVIDCIDYGFLN